VPHIYKLTGTAFDLERSSKTLSKIDKTGTLEEVAREVDRLFGQTLPLSPRWNPALSATLWIHDCENTKTFICWYVGIGNPVFWRNHVLSPDEPQPLADEFRRLSEDRSKNK
jgi:hypothetical protein